MKFRNHNFAVATLLLICAVSLAVTGSIAQQLATSHQPVPEAAPIASVSADGLVKPVARVNGAVLTEHDLTRELYTIFPYANQHNGIPKSMEPEMRRGALEMIIFEELLYQEAERQKLAISPERMKRAEADFRKQFSTREQYEQVLKAEVNGSLPLMRQKIRRALLIQDMLDREVGAKSKVSVVEARAFYDKNPKLFQHPESFRIQTISIIPPATGGADVQREARKLADSAIVKARATKSYQEFGLLAEKISDDDWHVNMGDRKDVTADRLPPEVVKAARALKPGEVSGLIQLGSAYTIVRVNGHVPAGKTSFAEVKAKLSKDLQKAKYEKTRALLAKRLRQNAKIEEL